MSKSSPSPANLLAQIARIDAMEFGKPSARASLWQDLLLRDRVADVIAPAERLQTQGAAPAAGVKEHLGFIRRH